MAAAKTQVVTKGAARSSDGTANETGAPSASEPEAPPVPEPQAPAPPAADELDPISPDVIVTVAAEPPETPEASRPGLVVRLAMAAEAAQETAASQALHAARLVLEEGLNALAAAIQHTDGDLRSDLASLEALIR